MPTKTRFKKGDLVRVREWDDMVHVYGTSSQGSIPCDATFITDMGRYCGRVFRIRMAVTETRYKLVGLSHTWSDDMLDPFLTR